MFAAQLAGRQAAQCAGDAALGLEVLFGVFPVKLKLLLPRAGAVKTDADVVRTRRLEILKGPDDLVAVVYGALLRAQACYVVEA